MNIKIGNYKITSDAFQFILSETKVKTSGKNEGLEYDTNHQHFPTISGALNSLVGKRLRKSEATTLAGLRKDLKQIRSELYVLFFEKVA